MQSCLVIITHGLLKHCNTAKMQSGVRLRRVGSYTALVYYGVITAFIINKH